MRISLVTPFADKDKAKALGARWDSTQKIWYIVDIADLTPFIRWIPDMNTTMDGARGQGGPDALKLVKAPSKVSTAPASTTSAFVAPHCGWHMGRSNGVIERLRAKPPSMVQDKEPNTTGNNRPRAVGQYAMRGPAQDSYASYDN